MLKHFFAYNKKSKGFTLIETIIGVAIFVLISTAIWQGFVKIIEGVSILKVRNTATALVNEQFEIIRNMPYEDVGILNGLPAGEVPKNQIITRDGMQFNLTASILNIDDPFDGVVGGDPNDLSPADNKLVEFFVECLGCKGLEPFYVTTRIAPRNLENEENTGALFVQVLDAAGDPISGADVVIDNNVFKPAFHVEEVTANNGMFQLIGAPPGSEAYEVFVTKEGYTSEQTYPSGEVSNPVPDNPHANVNVGLITQLTFRIDKVSQIKVNTIRSNCSPVSNVDFNFYGNKTIGENVLKHSYSFVTNSIGEKIINDVEWDTYNIDISDPSFFLMGSNPSLPTSVNPNSYQEIDLVLESNNPGALLVKVIERGTGLPISDAKVRLTKSGFDESKYTGRGALSQTDWSGGSGQSQIGDYERYYSQDGNIEDSNPFGQIKLKELTGDYTSDGSLISSIFDTATTTNFHVLNWLPQAQPSETGPDPVKFQVATNDILNASTTWDFVGPDGTSNSYFSNSGEPFNSIHSGDRYLRYKVDLSTATSTISPLVSDVSFSFSTDCAPSGQAYFDGLDDGSYDLEVSKNGYENYIYNISVDEDWQMVEILMDPSI